MRVIPINLSSPCQLESLRTAVANAGVFFVAPIFNLWYVICGPDMECFALANQVFLSERRDSYENCYAECKRVNRLARAVQGSSAVVAVLYQVPGNRNSRKLREKTLFQKPVIRIERVMLPAVNTFMCLAVPVGRVFFLVVSKRRCRKKMRILKFLVSAIG